MAWSVPEKIQLKMLHQLELRDEPGLIRVTSRETSCLIRRPDHGEIRVAVKCGQCGREGIFVIHDFETTKNLRRSPVQRSLIAAVVILMAVVSLWVVGLVFESALVLVLAVFASIVLGPIGIFMAVDPSSNIGVQPPEPVRYSRETTREGFMTYVSRNPRRAEGLYCSGHAQAAK